jgi:chromosome segregation ATPase
VAALIEEIATQNQIHSQQMDGLRGRIYELQAKNNQTSLSTESTRSRRTVSEAVLNQPRPQTGRVTDKKAFSQRMSHIKEEFRALAGSNARLNEWLSVSFMSIFAHFDAILDANLVAEMRIAELTEALRRARAEMGELKGLQQTTLSQQARIEELESEIENLHSRAAQLLQVTAGRRQAINEHAEEIRLLQDHNDRLKQELEFLRSSIKDTGLNMSIIEQSVDPHREVFLLREQLEFTTEELKKSILERNTAHQRILDLQAAELQVQVLQKERARQQAELDTASRRLHDSVFLMQSSATSNIEGLTRELEHSRQTLSEELETSQRKVEQLQAERDRLHAELQLSEREYEEQIVQMENLHKVAIDSLRSGLHDAESRLKERERRINHLVSEVTAMTKLCNDLRHDHDMANENLARTRDGTSNLRKLRSRKPAN